MRYFKSFGWMVLMVCCSMNLAIAQTSVDEHWSGYDYPKVIPEGVKHHIIVDGDTLWSITETYHGDPLLWPQVYAKNPYIADPNLIYPGDPIFLDIGVVVGDETIAETVEEDPSVQPEGGDAESGEFSDESTDTEVTDEDQGEEDLSNVSELTDFDLDSAEFVILPAGNRGDMECSTYIESEGTPKDPPFDIKVAGGENRFLHAFGPGDVVYLNKGHDDGLVAGDSYAGRRVGRTVQSGDGKNLGFAVVQTGRIKIIATQANNATAIIEDACFELRPGDFVVKYEQEPIPLITEMPKIEKYAEIDTSDSGNIVYSQDGLGSFGNGHLANVDLGIDRNVAPGDIFTVFKPNPSGDQYPPIFLGHLVALKVYQESTVVKVVNAVSEMRVGNMVVPASVGQDFLD